MCGIAGYFNLTSGKPDVDFVLDVLSLATEQIIPRGPDALGALCLFNDASSEECKLQITAGSTKARLTTGLVVAKSLFSNIGAKLGNRPEKSIRQLNAVLINARGIPTTEFEGKMGDLDAEEIQPFYAKKSGKIIAAVAHNGTVANDAEMAAGKRWMSHSMRDRYVTKDIDTYSLLTPMVKHPQALASLLALDGSYALAAWTSHRFMLARNYLGLHCLVASYRAQTYLFFSSEPFPSDIFAKQATLGQKYDACGHSFEFPPYSFLELRNKQGDGEAVAGGDPATVASNLRALIETFGDNDHDTKKALISLSGGLDSTTAATLACTQFDEVHLMHFNYACKATSQEHAAVKAIHAYLSDKFPSVVVKLVDVDMTWLSRFGGSRLTAVEDTIVDGDKGAELATEWVPARNLCMSSVAAAYCDANNIGTVMLGVNREESATYCLSDLGDATIRLWDGLSKKPSQVKVGDEVACCDPRTNTACKGTVVKTFTRESSDIYELRFGLDGGAVSETVYPTGDHSWLTKDKGWVETRDLAEGDRLARLGDLIVEERFCRTLSVQFVKKTDDRLLKVHDFTCEPHHNYFVGRQGAISHNCDNSTEFYTALNVALQLGTVSRPKIVSPLGNMLKHHIWALGRELGAPLNLTWSCYREGIGPRMLRCGTCGPCLNLRRAAEMNGDTIPFEYAATWPPTKSKGTPPKWKE